MIIRVFNKDLPLRNLLFVIIEGGLILLAVILAAKVRYTGMPEPFLSAAVLYKSLIITLACQFSLYYNDLYNLKVTDTYVELALRLTKALGVASIVLAILYYIVPSFMMGRGIFFLSLLFLIFLVVPWRYVYNWMLKKKMMTEKILLLGWGVLSRQIIKEIAVQPDSGFQVAGVLPMSKNEISNVIQDTPLCSMNGSLNGLAKNLKVSRIVVAMDEKRGKLPTKELLQCKMEGIEILEGESLYEELTGKLFIEKLNPSWIIFSSGFRKKWTTQFSKRFSGLFLSLLGLFLTLPLICLIAIAIKLNSKGPVFYRQKRCTKDGKIFNVVKFRSMVHNAEALTGPKWATENDPRITSVGAILRKYRLDELPQMWNVLVGDMSFVGPRPERPEFVSKLAETIPYYHQRHAVKPGITGWAQVCYRYGASVDDALEKLKYDLFYVKNMSFALDILIIFRTIKIVMLQSGAR